MSKIRLHGSSSGYTEIAPVAASGNNTLTLPNDGTIISKDSNGAVGVTSITVGTGVTIGDGRVTCSTLHGSAANCTLIPAANIVGLATAGFNRSGGFPEGVTDADQWYLTSTFQGSVDPIQNNLSRYTAAGNLGSAMTVSSGIWTFPSTGFWRIDVSAQAKRASGYQNAYAQWRTILSTDNFSSEFIAAIADAGYFDNYSAGTDRYQGGFSTVVFDVTNVSTHKLKFKSVVQDNVTWGADSTIPATMFQFTRLGDT